MHMSAHIMAVTVYQVRVQQTWLTWANIQALVWYSGPEILLQLFWCFCCCWLVLGQSYCYTVWSAIGIIMSSVCLPVCL